MGSLFRRQAIGVCWWCSAERARAEPSPGREHGATAGSGFPNPMGVFLSSSFSSLSKVGLGFPSSLMVVRPSLPLKPRWLYLVRLVKMSQFSVERKGSSKDKRHWKEPPLTSHPPRAFSMNTRATLLPFPVLFAVFTSCSACRPRLLLSAATGHGGDLGSPALHPHLCWQCQAAWIKARGGC